MSFGSGQIGSIRNLQAYRSGVDNVRSSVQSQDIKSANVNLQKLLRDLPSKLLPDVKKLNGIQNELSRMEKTLKDSAVINPKLDEIARELNATSKKIKEKEDALNNAEQQNKILSDNLLKKIQDLANQSAITGAIEVKSMISKDRLDATNEEILAWYEADLARFGQKGAENKDQLLKDAKSVWENHKKYYPEKAEQWLESYREEEEKQKEKKQAHDWKLSFEKDTRPIKLPEDIVTQPVETKEYTVSEFKPSFLNQLAANTILAIEKIGAFGVKAIDGGLDLIATGAAVAATPGAALCDWALGTDNVNKIWTNLKDMTGFINADDLREEINPQMKAYLDLNADEVWKERGNIK